MMSRTGKSTSNMYMAFQKKLKPRAQAQVDSESQISLNDISETSSENDSEDEKNALQLRNNKLKLTIDTEMRKIEDQMKVQQMSRTKKIKKELQKKFGKESKVTEQDISKQMMEINRRNLTANFQTTSRDHHQFIFRNKTDPPEVGKYHPTTIQIDKKVKVVNLDTY